MSAAPEKMIDRISWLPFTHTKTLPFWGGLVAGEEAYQAHLQNMGVFVPANFDVVAEIFADMAEIDVATPSSTFRSLLECCIIFVINDPLHDPTTLALIDRFIATLCVH